MEGTAQGAGGSGVSAEKRGAVMDDLDRYIDERDAREPGFDQAIEDMARRMVVLQYAWRAALCIGWGVLITLVVCW